MRVVAADSPEFPPKVLRDIKGLIFDFDGTLFDNELFPFYLIAANPLDLLRVWKERLVRTSFAGCDYASPEEYYKAFFSAFGKACLCSPERIRNWYFSRYMPRMVRVVKKHYNARPGARELFHNFDVSVNDKYPVPRVAVYSDYPFLKERMEALGLTTSANIPLYGPDSFGAQKPASRPFLNIAGDLGVPPEQVLVIGDREETDGIGAFKAGMRFFFLNTKQKRYSQLDPNRYPRKDCPKGPALVMYAGVWDDLIKLLQSYVPKQNFVPVSKILNKKVCL